MYTYLALRTHDNNLMHCHMHAHVLHQQSAQLCLCAVLHEVVHEENLAPRHHMDTPRRQQGKVREW